MKEKSARKHRSKPLLQKTSRRIEIFIPRETDIDITNANPTQREIALTSSMGPIVKQEQDVKLSSLSSTLESEKDNTPQQSEQTGFRDSPKNSVRSKSPIHQIQASKRPTLPDAVFLDEFHTGNYCTICQKTFQSFVWYRRHLKSDHQMKLTLLIPTPNLEITPDTNNPTNNHCDSCNRTLTTREYYRRHLKAVHKIILKPIPDPKIVPDINNPRFFCKSCQFKFKSLNLYRMHLKRIHKMELEPLVKKPIYNPSISMEDVLKDPNNSSCVICKVTFRDKHSLKGYMENIHKERVKRQLRTSTNTTTIKPNNIEPPLDSNGDYPNHYFSTCRKSHSTRTDYFYHMHYIHPNIKLKNFNWSPGVTALIAEMDAGNKKNKTCRICDKEYSCRSSYKSHMNLVHKDGNREQPVVPIWDDPNQYCRSCKRTFSTRHAYNIHVKSIHKKVLMQAIQLASEM